MRNSNPKYIDHHFSNLEHIQFPLYAVVNGDRLIRMDNKIFDLNPQLRSIHITDLSDLDILRSANEKLYHLEVIRLEFQLDIFNASCDTIRFKNVKQLHLTGSCQYFRDHIEPKFPLEFDQLEEMDIEIRAHYSADADLIRENWRKLIVQQDKLKILTIRWRIAKMTFEEWMSIIDGSSKLEVVKTYCYPHDVNDGIARVMATKTKLKKIVLFGMTKDDYDTLKKRIDPKWQIKGDIQSNWKETTFIYV